MRYLYMGAFSSVILVMAGCFSGRAHTVHPSPILACSTTGTGVQDMVAGQLQIANQVLAEASLHNLLPRQMSGRTGQNWQEPLLDLAGALISQFGGRAPEVYASSRFLEQTFTISSSHVRKANPADFPFPDDGWRDLKIVESATDEFATVSLVFWLDTFLPASQGRYIFGNNCVLIWQEDELTPVFNCLKATNEAGAD